ncbi:hypothetical protein BDW02DRAFT_588352 [Decorospora gaudefroyi]|uniref:NAD(P)-binding protein n=1 Tax=Decorospora gaudefroyi TaxID=184978 RepID=A0A6A5KCT4_9PLEO|nr:hypothetical protein BDW02DRAFT_588352 [Decorospora gaudefroyi]
MSAFRDIAPRPQDLPPASAGSNAAKDSARPSRCDGARPTCRSCVERDSRCEYGPPTGPLLVQAQKRKIEELENDKSSLYEVLWYLQTTSPDKATALLQQIRASEGEDLGAILKNFEQSRGADPVAETTVTAQDSPSTESSSSVILAVPELMDHPRLSTVRKGQARVNGAVLVSPSQKNATVDDLQGPLNMFFNCVGALFYIMNRDEVQATMARMTASGNNHTALGDFFSSGSSLQLRTFAAELAGMASIGVVHSQLADPATAPPAELADYFYTVAKHGLDSAILYNPLRAMKVCALVGMYNIVVKATVALAYIELGLSLARNQKLNLKECPPGWSTSSGAQAPVDDIDAPPEDMIRRECVKVSIIKAALLHRLPKKAPVAEAVTLDFRAQLSRFHAQLPEWMTAAELLSGGDGELMAQFRPVIFYVHLFYLSAMMLLSRRLIIAYIPQEAVGRVYLPPEAQRAVEEGYQAAQMNASVMKLMLQEGKVVQVCWLCIYTSFTAGIMIAHKAAQKALHGDPFAKDMELLNKCIAVLDYCALKDALAGKFRTLLTGHLNTLREHNATMDGLCDVSTPTDLPETGYLFTFHSGSTKLHAAARNLLRAIHRPFSGLKNVATQKTLSNRAETTMGTHLEWEYELKACGCTDKQLKDGGCSEPLTGIPEPVDLEFSGGSGAVGTVVGKAILESGGDVLFLDRVAHTSHETEALTHTAKTHNTTFTSQPLDLQSEPSITHALTTAHPHLRHPIRGLVSCAAISGESDAIPYPTAPFRQILDINTTGTFLIARAVAQAMHSAHVSGSIVLFASISGHVANRGINTAAYNASKAGVQQLARSLAAEWGHPLNTFAGSTGTDPEVREEARGVYPPIRVNTVSPGHIDTPLSAAARERGLTEAWCGQNMLGRISVAEEMRAPVLFLLGEGSSYVTGADLRVDGGHCAW